VGWLLGWARELGFKRLKTGVSGVNWRGDGLELAGRGLIDGGSVGARFGDDALNLSYTHTGRFNLGSTHTHFPGSRMAAVNPLR
jgi:hypothetical protein